MCKWDKIMLCEHRWCKGPETPREPTVTRRRSDLGPRSAHTANVTSAKQYKTLRFLRDAKRTLGAPQLPRAVPEVPPGGALELLDGLRGLPSSAWKPPDPPGGAPGIALGIQVWPKAPSICTETHYVLNCFLLLTRERPEQLFHIYIGNSFKLLGHVGFRQAIKMGHLAPQGASWAAIRICIYMYI